MPYFDASVTFLILTTANNVSFCELRWMLSSGLHERVWFFPEMMLSLCGMIDWRAGSALPPSFDRLFVLLKVKSMTRVTIQLSIESKVLCGWDWMRQPNSQDYWKETVLIYCQPDRIPPSTWSMMSNHEPSIWMRIGANNIFINDHIQYTLSSAFDAHLLCPWPMSNVLDGLTLFWAVHSNRIPSVLASIIKSPSGFPWLYEACAEGGMVADPRMM